ncbi:MULTISPECIES: S8 family serine peptidase [unclassified Pseudoalteromonas]|uniref:S8 family serine peptidase n=1 Tax=unclassified Pseudoalteromonas TaxID=194690 RepID=UPI000C077033|nr:MULTISPECIES: S8 family serine peptidase [unclassified Pseudoalteromonas]MDP2633441.1 S8 family serine peptidase [Pseudoalteromonas sp. 1_MG-2023]PHN90534.1 peptidase S8 [Pseudoalteromonas sp. 3D05]
MSKNLIKRTAVATAVTSVLIAGAANANSINQSALKHQGYTPISQADVADKKEPTSFLVVLKATTAADMMEQGTYSVSSARASYDNVQTLQSQVKDELFSLDSNVKILGETKILAPTLIIQASPGALEKIKNDPRVDRVLPMFDYDLHVAASADYIKATPVVTGGMYTGSTQKVAVLDTGIDYTHAIFGGAGTVEAYDEAQSDPTMVAWPQGQVMGGYDFMRDDADPIENDPENPTEEDAPTSHGTSVSHSVTGIAPDVELYVYSVCGGGCPSDAQSAALEAAMDPNGDGDTSDHVDVINMSLGGEFGDTYIGGGTQFLIQQAVEAGVNVVISAGNDGDNPFRIGGPSTTPNALSVGAMTHPANDIGVASGTIAGEETIIQPSGFGPQTAFEMTEVDAEVVYPEANQNGCEAFADEIDFTGKAVLIDRGACAFTQKVLNAQARGAAFVFIANNTDDGTPAPMGGFDADVTIRNVGINFAAGAAMKAQLDAGNAATYSIMVERKVTAGAVASFSSRGPSMDGLLKPEITAPGTDIMVAATGTQDGLAPATGTSFSGPITAGAVALVREAHPDRNALEIKATIMNAADLNVTVDPLTINPDSPLAPISLIGAGLVDVEKAVNLPVAAWVVDDEYQTAQAALSFGLERMTEMSSFTKTVTLKNFSDEDKTYDLRIEERFMNDADSGAVSFDIPRNVTVAANEEITFDVTMTVDPTKLHDWTLENPFDADDLAARSPSLTMAEFDGALVFDDVSTTDTDHDLHVVYHALPKAGAELEFAYEEVNGVVEVVVTNVGSASAYPIAESVIATSEENAEADFDILSTTFAAYTSENCDSGVLITSSIQLRDEITHMRQVGVRMNLDTDNDGVYDHFMMNLNDVGRSAAIPGRSRTLIGTIDADGNDGWMWGTAMYHAAGEDTVTFSGCSELMGLDASMLGSQINVQASVGYPSYQAGVYFETDSVTGSTTFTGAPRVDLVSTEDSEMKVSELAPGQSAVFRAESDFALTSANGTDVYLNSITETAEVPMVPNIVASELSINEMALDGITIGRVEFVEEPALRITEYTVVGMSAPGLMVDAETGDIMVEDSSLLDFESEVKEIMITVKATDLLGTESEEAVIKVMITNDADELPVVTPGQKFSVIETAPEGTVIGMLDHTLFESAATMVSGGKVTNTNAVSINDKGELVVSGSMSYYETPTIALEVMLMDDSGLESETATVMLNVTADPKAHAPVIEGGQQFRTDENVPLGTVLGQLVFSDPDADISPITRFIVSGTTLVKVELDGSIVTMGEIDYEFDSEIVFSVQAEDSKGYVSKAVSVEIDVNNLRANDDDDNDESGSLAWLTLLAAPFAFMRRRKQK